MNAAFFALSHEDVIPASEPQDDTLSSASTDGDCSFLASDSSHKQGLTEEQREAAIVRAGKSIERHMALYRQAVGDYDLTGSDHYKFKASRHHVMAQEAARLMAELIKGRSREQVAKMERERGLA